MTKRVASEDKTEKIRSASLQTATSILQIRERATGQTKEELVQALVIMRATLEATLDGILVTDEKGKVTEFNDKYLDMWKIPREVAGGRHAGRCAGVREPELCGSASVFRSYRGN